MTDNSPPPAVPRLDATTELCIGALRDAAVDYQHARDHGKELCWSDVTHAENTLRVRIAQLISEARAEGAQAQFELHRQAMRDFP